jgi:hypothetical protein
MKNAKLEFPYISYEMEVTYDMIEEMEEIHPTFEDSIKRVFKTESDYYRWVSAHNRGHVSPIKLRVKAHIGKLITTPQFIGNMIGLSIVVVPVLAVLGLAVYGAVKLIDMLF